MAFERKILGLTTSGQDVLVCGIGLSIVVHSLTITNDTGAARVVTLSFYDQANGVTLPLGKLNVGANASARWPDKVNLAPGDKLIASADAGDAVTLYAGYLQQGGAAPVASGFVVRGVWSNLADYDQLDIVSKSDIPYVAIQPSTNQDPSTATAYWLKLLDATVIAAALAAKADVTYVDAAVAALIDAAPGALDTLNELAAALGDDANFASTITTALAGKQPLNATLTAFAGQTIAANDLIYGTGTGAVGKTTLSSFGRSLIDDPDAGAARVTLGVVGKQSIPVPAGAMLAATTNGAASGKVETSSNKVMLNSLDFDAATIESAQFAIPMPKQWNEGTVTFQVVWKHAATSGSFGVVWGLSGVAVSDDDAADVAFGTEVTVTDTGGTTNDVYISAESGAVTIAGTPQAGDLVFFRLRRVASDGADTLAIDAGLLAINLFITTDAGNDA